MGPEPPDPCERVGTSPTSPDTRCEPSTGYMYSTILFSNGCGMAFCESGRGCISAWCGPKNTERHPNCVQDKFVRRPESADIAESHSRPCRYPQTSMCPASAPPARSVIRITDSMSWSAPSLREFDASATDEWRSALRCMGHACNCRCAPPWVLLILWRHHAAPHSLGVYRGDRQGCHLGSWLRSSAPSCGAKLLLVSQSTNRRHRAKMGNAPHSVSRATIARRFLGGPRVRGCALWKRPSLGSPHLGAPHLAAFILGGLSGRP